MKRLKMWFFRWRYQHVGWSEVYHMPGFKLTALVASGQPRWVRRRTTDFRTRSWRNNPDVFVVRITKRSFRPGDFVITSKGLQWSWDGDVWKCCSHEKVPTINDRL